MAVDVVVGVIVTDLLAEAVIEKGTVWLKLWLWLAVTAAVNDLDGDTEAVGESESVDDSIAVIEKVEVPVSVIVRTIESDLLVEALMEEVMVFVVSTDRVKDVDIEPLDALVSVLDVETDGLCDVVGEGLSDDVNERLFVNVGLREMEVDVVYEPVAECDSVRDVLAAPEKLGVLVSVIVRTIDSELLTETLIVELLVFVAFPSDRVNDADVETVDALVSVLEIETNEDCDMVAVVLSDNVNERLFVEVGVRVMDGDGSGVLLADCDTLGDPL